MGFIDTLVAGEQALFKPEKLTPMQENTLRFVVIGLVYYGFAVVEGMIMRLYEVKPFPLVDKDQFFAILTAHPLIGIFGSTYAIVFGAFLFLVPFLLKRPLQKLNRSLRLYLLVGSDLQNSLAGQPSWPVNLL